MKAKTQQGNIGHESNVRATHIEGLGLSSNHWVASRLVHWLCQCPNLCLCLLIVFVIVLVIFFVGHTYWGLGGKHQPLSVLTICLLTVILLPFKSLINWCQPGVQMLFGCKLTSPLACKFTHRWLFVKMQCALPPFPREHCLDARRHCLVTSCRIQQTEFTSRLRFLQ